MPIIENAESLQAAQAGPFDSQELSIIDTAAQKYSSTEERNKIASQLFNELNSVPGDLRSKMLQHMEDKLNPKDPLDRVNKELSLIPQGVSCVHNADKFVIAATVNGYEMEFKAPAKLNAPFDRQNEAQRVIEMAKQNTGDPRIHDFGPANKTEYNALKNALADELASLGEPGRNSVLSYMFDRYSSKDQLDKNRREQAGIPQGVELLSQSATGISVDINGMYLSFESKGSSV